VEKFNRAERRAQTARLKAKRKHYWGYGHAYGQEGVSEMSPTQLGRVVQYPQACSCPLGCANARGAYGRSLKEIVQMIEEKEGIMSLH
jgi:hypothetical protein